MHFTAPTASGWAGRDVPRLAALVAAFAVGWGLRAWTAAAPPPAHAPARSAAPAGAATRATAVSALERAFRNARYPTAKIRVVAEFASTADPEDFPTAIVSLPDLWNGLNVSAPFAALLPELDARAYAAALERPSRLARHVPHNPMKLAAKIGFLITSH